MSPNAHLPFVTVNRAIVTIRAKQPFLDWLESLPDRAPGETCSLEMINEDNTAFLVPDYGDNEKIKKYVESISLAIFEEQLEGWYIDENYWPKNPTIKMFWEWFDIEIHSIILDTLEKDIEKEP